jgi:energy-coupling factor transporter ATP-binding protein EcfA2
VRLNHDLGTTVVLAEHRLERAAPLADRAVLVEEGLVGTPAAVGAVLATYPGAPSVTRLGRLLGWEPLPLTVRDARSQAALHPPLLDPPAPVDAAVAPGDPILHARGLRVALGSRNVVRGVDLELCAGDVIALFGRNGAGKTTLLRALAGLVAPSDGAIDTRGRVAYVPQNPNTMLFSSSVRRELVETQKLLGKTDPVAVDRWLDALHLTDLAEAHPRSLSGGQRQRVAIAAVAVGGAPVLLLDEPTRGMDAPSRTALEHAVREHSAAGGAVVLATHDVELAARIASHAVVLGDGEIVADGDARTVLAGSLFAPQVLRVLPPFLTVEEVDKELARS